MSEKRTNISSQQKSELLEFLEKNPNLRTGKFSKDFTNKEAQRLWEIIAEQLNALPGAQKDWFKWRKTWHDMKASAKGKRGEIKKHARCTGGGAATKTKLNVEEDRIIDMIGETAIEGHANVEESPAVFEDSAVYNDVEMICDHDYNKENVIQWIANEHGEEIFAVAPSTPDPVPSSSCTVLENHAECSSIKQPPPSKTPRKYTPQGIRSCKKQRLEHTILASDRLATHVAEKIQIKKEYYKMKLELMAKDVNAKIRIAEALEALVRQ